MWVTIWVKAGRAANARLQEEAAAGVKRSHATKVEGQLEDTDIVPGRKVLINEKTGESTQVVTKR